MVNMGYLHYTYAHRIAFRYVVEKLVKNQEEKEELLVRARYHDLDKAFLYTLIDKKDASDYHRMHCSHHMCNAIPKSRLDRLEAVLDYECAGYTKEDKPRNAYDTIRELFPQDESVMMPILHELGIDYSYENKPDDEEWVAFLKNERKWPPTDEGVMEEIYDYVLSHADEVRKLYDFAQNKRFLNEKQDSVN